MGDQFVAQAEDIFKKADITKILKGCRFKYVGKQVDGYQDWPGLELANGRKYVDKIPGKPYLVAVSRYYKGKAEDGKSLSEHEEGEIAFMEVFTKNKKYQTFYLAEPAKGAR